jgi:hypothetical protein
MLTEIFFIAILPGLLMEWDGTKKIVPWVKLTDPIPWGSEKHFFFPSHGMGFTSRPIPWDF